MKQVEVSKGLQSELYVWDNPDYGAQHILAFRHHIPLPRPLPGKWILNYQQPGEEICQVPSCHIK